MYTMMYTMYPVLNPSALTVAYLCDVGQLSQVELVVELDCRRQEVVHDMSVQLNGSIHQL